MSEKRSTGTPDPYAVTGVDPETPAGAKRFDIAETSQDDGFLLDIVDGVSVVKPTTENIVDAVQIERLGDAIQGKLSDQATPKILMDMSAVRHMSSAALGMLLKLRTFATGRGGDIGLAEMNDQIREVFKLTKLDRMLKIHDDRAKAIRSMK